MSLFLSNCQAAYYIFYFDIFPRRFEEKKIEKSDEIEETFKGNILHLLITFKSIYLTSVNMCILVILIEIYF